ncbi:succinate dehydrogenase assembly factor 2 [Extensimonas perlucida]|uniref:FAD assembly factor SdhE n=1 Tax=Extensimonas perlucida TaxID=2590786 RepID=UPI00119F9437|nr:succinate dehydrogenase assembly factor 2 [Extensimonas perlucida]
MGESFSAADALLNERELSKLHWRCRRGLLENDLFISRFFARFESELRQSHARGLLALMDLADNDLLDLLLRRREPAETLDTPEVCTVLAMLRQGTAVIVPGTADQTR